MTNEMVESAWDNIGFFLYQLDPEVKKLLRFERLHLKIFKKKQSTVFNQTCLYIYIYTHTHTHTHTHIYIYIYIYIIYVCVCVCVCVCEKCN